MKESTGVYRKASKASMIFGVAVSGGGTCFYMLMMYASYIASEGFGIATAIAGLIITGSRIFDGITDPIVAMIFDRWKPGKHGKLRIFMLLGWAIMSIADLMMYSWLVGKFDGVPACLIFILLYMVHIIGYTIFGIAGFVIQAAITNDPVQRPFMQTINVFYSYLVPMTLSTFMSFVVLPKYDNQYNAACLSEACLWYIGISLIFVLLCCFAIRDIDNPEILSGIESGNSQQKIGFKDMWSLLKDNKPLRMYVITGASDKIAQQTSAQTIVATLMSGILIANYKAATMIGNTTMLVGIIFAVLGGIFIAKTGAKKATSVWSAISIALAVITVVFCWKLGPAGMKEIGVMGVPMMVYVVLMIGTSGAKMVLSTAAGTMRSDIIDYELERSGKYMPGFVSAVYNFVDKIVSSLASTIAAFCVAFIGYKNTMPQMGDKATWPLFWMTMFLMFGLPIIGWLCNIFAMKGYELDAKRMVEVQTNIAEKKKEAQQANA